MIGQELRTVYLYLNHRRSLSSTKPLILFLLLKMYMRLYTLFKRARPFFYVFLVYVIPDVITHY